MAAETQYTANTGIAKITTGNTNLTGGTIGTNIWTVITADNAKNGLILKTVTIKAQTNTAQGILRLYIYDGTNQRLVSEIEIPAVTKSETDPAFEITIPVDYALKPNWSLLASSQNSSETINVIAEGMDWVYYTNSVRPESSKYTANTGMAKIDAANTGLDGAGSSTPTITIWNIITAASNGTLIQSISVKSLISGTNTEGMVRLFINDGTGDGNTKTWLLTEIPIPATTQSGTAHTFSRRIDFGGKGFFLKPGWILRATTHYAEAYNVIAEGLDLTYPA